MKSLAIVLVQMRLLLFFIFLSSIFGNLIILGLFKTVTLNVTMYILTALACPLKITSSKIDS